jgi:uncharacterized protein YkwD
MSRLHPTLTRAVAGRPGHRSWRALGLALALAAGASLAHAQGTPAAVGPASPDREASSESAVTAQLLELVNRARAEARTWGPERYAGAPALRRQPPLDAAARAHVRDLSARGAFDLRGSDGSTTEARVEREGYRWSGIGENLADRHLVPEPIVQGWLTDPMQCSNIMHPAFTEVGLARSTPEPGSSAGVVWSMVVARPRAQPR